MNMSVNMEVNEIVFKEIQVIVMMCCIVSCIIAYPWITIDQWEHMGITC